MDRPKILVVDDEERMRKLLHDFLYRDGYDVVEAENGQQALDIFSKYAVLAAVSFIRHDQNIVIRIDWRLVRLVELLDQREDKARVSLELFDQVCSTGGHELLALRLSQ